MPNGSAFIKRMVILYGLIKKDHCATDILLKPIQLQLLKGGGL
jgi:hypothetical protein